MIVTASYPYGPGEGFLVDEIAALGNLVTRLILVPAFPRGELRNDFANSGNIELVPGTHGSALRRQPEAAGSSAVAAVFGGEIGVRHAARNLAGAVRGSTVTAAARRSRVQHIHAYWLSVPAGVALRTSRATGIPWSASSHRFDIFQANRLPLKLANAQFVRTISHLGAEHLRSLAPSERVEYVPLGIAQPARAVPSPPSSKRVLCAANFVPIKGHEYLLRAISMMQRAGVEVRLDLAGEGPTMGHVRSLVEELDLREVTFLGQLERTEILAGHRSRRWRVAVLPSVDLGRGEHEGVPISLVEAMSNGIPVVSTLSGSIPDLLASAGPYALVPPSDPQSLADSIGILMQSDWEWELASRAAVQASQPWRAERTAAQLFTFMQGASN